MSESEDPAMKPEVENPTDLPNWELPRSLRSIETRLAELSPRDDRLDRERLMFLAGQASVESTSQEQNRELNSRKHLRAWQTAFAGMTAAAASLLVLLVTRPAIVEPSTPFARDVATITQRSEPTPTASNHDATLPANVLSARDILSHNFERQLTKQESQSLAGESKTVAPSDIPQPTPLTPAAWRQVFSTPEASAAPANGAFNPPVYRGTRT